MRSWYHYDKLKIGAMALAAGLVVGLIVTYTAGLGTSKPKLAASDSSVAAAVAGDGAKPPASMPRLSGKAPVKVQPKPKARVKRVAAKRPTRRSGRTRRAASAPGTDVASATPKPRSGVKAERKTSAAAPVRAAPRRQATQRVVTKRRATITPQQRATPKSTPAPAPAPARPAPVASAPQPAPAPTAAPTPAAPPRPTHGHGNGDGGDDDPGGD